MRNYTAHEKAAIVFSLLGDEMLGAILAKLPEPLKPIIRDQISPLMEKIQLPEDVDAFVLEHIINAATAPAVPDTAPQESLPDRPEAPDRQTPSAPPPSEPTQELVAWMEISVDSLIIEAPVAIIAGLLGRESQAMQSVILHSFPPQRQQEILGVMKRKGPVDAQLPAKVVESLRIKLWDVFVGKLREACKQADS